MHLASALVLASIRLCSADYLFDISVDPLEAVDVIKVTGYASKLAAIQTQMSIFQQAVSQSTSDNFVSPPQSLFTIAGGVVPGDFSSLPSKPATSQLPGTPYATAPHIIYVLIDDAGQNDLSFDGATSSWASFATPNLNRLALGGIRLTNFYTAWICSASRSALLTGRYPPRFGYSQVPGTAVNLPLSETTLAQEFHRYGYRTALIGKMFFSSFNIAFYYITTGNECSCISGKWHMGFQNSSYLPTYRGFDSFYGVSQLLINAMNFIR